jgi:alkanesulfonate monooxygenase SsuD/methylene tetrahydromethanopterin reductase-like flavin-dependent oxidoreductase (luciferase family)
MKVGIATFVTDRGIRPGPLAAAVEQRGFHSLIIAEHSHMPYAFDEPYSGTGDLPHDLYRTCDPFVALACAAATTHTLTLTTGVVLLAQRDVIYTAKEVATLDLVSNGRVIFGVGVGSNRHEMRHHGVAPKTRGAKVTSRYARSSRSGQKTLRSFTGGLSISVRWRPGLNRFSNRIR